MKAINIITAAMLAVGFSGAAYAQMGKCGAGSGMQQGNGMGMQKGGMMSDEMRNNKMMMLQHLDGVKKCVDSASTMDELKACNMKMRNNGPMMQQRGGTKKCGGNG